MGPGEYIQHVRAYVKNMAVRLESYNLDFDVSYRLEGTLEAITLFARSIPLPDDVREILRRAVITACKVCNYVEEIGKHDARELWPTNRYALELFTVLGFQKPA